LIQYNTADIVHLKPLMERGYQEMKTQLLSFKPDPRHSDGPRHAFDPLEGWRNS
jgi:hypothetical protein